MNEFAAYVGWDWADREHQVSLREVGRVGVEASCVKGTPEELHGWASKTLARYGGRQIAVAIDAGRGAVISAFLGYPHIVIYPINPKSAADLRKALYPSGKKDDPIDSEMLLEMVEKHCDRLRPLKPADVMTRELVMLTEHRRKLDNDRKREINRLRDALKSYYPQVLELFEELSTLMVFDFLDRWSSLEVLKRAHESTITAFFRQHNSRSNVQIEARLSVIRAAVRLTDDAALVRSGAIRVRSLVLVLRALVEAIASVDRDIATTYAAHPEHDLIDSFAGLGSVLGPRMAAVLGCDRERFENAEALQRMTGVAPVTMRTGGREGTISVHRRLRRSKFMHQTLVEWAHCSLPHCAWAKAYYDMKKEQNPNLRHYTIMRAIAFKWLRIIYRCWADGTLYDEKKYLTELARRGAPLAKRLAAAA